MQQRMNTNWPETFHKIYSLVTWSWLRRRNVSLIQKGDNFTNFKASLLVWIKNGHVFQNNSSLVHISCVLSFIFKLCYTYLCFNRSVWRKSFLTSKVRINGLSQRGRPPMLPSVLHCCTVSVPYLIWFQKYVFHLLFYFQQRHFSFLQNLLVIIFNPKEPELLGGVFFGEMKFPLLNYLSNEDHSISYESWDDQLTFET